MDLLLHPQFLLLCVWSRREDCDRWMSTTQSHLVCGFLPMLPKSHQFKHETLKQILDQLCAVM